MKKISIITEDYWRGGLARFTVDLVDNWPDTDARFVIFTNRENTALRENIRNPRCEFVYFDFKTMLSDTGAKRGLLKKVLRRTLFKYWFFIRRFNALKRMIGSCAADGWIISNGGYPGSDLCRLALFILKKKRGVFVFHGAVQKPWPVFLPLEMALDLLIFRGNRFRIVTVSRANARTVSRRPWLARLRVAVIHNGIARKGKPLQKIRSSDKHVVAMFSGLRPYKGQSVVIRAARSLKANGFHLDVRFYGTDFERFLAGIRDMIRSSGCPEIFSLPGFCPVEKILEEADLVVVPSLTHESFGYTAAEAMSYGVPVVVSDVGGLPEVVGDSGVVCKAGDVDAWIRAIQNVLTDERLRENNIRKGLQKAGADFCVKTMALEYQKLLIRDE
jgi:glycosyltransferase involved in cell wall biosynthesis